MDTKERIVEQALRLFSHKGYEAVSIRELAAAVGIRESSIYNHFKSKQEIFDTIVAICSEQAASYFKKAAIPSSMADDLSVYRQIDPALLYGMIRQTCAYFFEDPTCVMFRRLLLVSQFTNGRARGLYKELYCDVPLAFQTQIFEMLIKNGEFRPADPEAVARAFYGPVFLLLHTCETMDEAEPALRAHVLQFMECYKK